MENTSKGEGKKSHLETGLAVKKIPCKSRHEKITKVKVNNFASDKGAGGSAWLAEHSVISFFFALLSHKFPHERDPTTNVSTQ